MKIRRCGARRFEGWTNIFDGKPTLRWDEKENTLALEVRDANGTSSSAYYNYDIELSIEDVNLILHFLSSEPLEKSGPAISEGIAASNPSLLRLLLSSLISDLEALRHNVATGSSEISKALSEVKTELRTLRTEVERLQSNDLPE